MASANYSTSRLYATGDHVCWHSQGIFTGHDISALAIVTATWSELARIEVLHLSQPERLVVDQKTLSVRLFRCPELDGGQR